MGFPAAQRDIHPAASEHIPLSAGFRTWPRPALASALLHVLVIALLIVRVALAPASHLSAPPLAEVELIQLNSPAVGGAPEPPKPGHATAMPHLPPAQAPKPPAVHTPAPAAPTPPRAETGSVPSGERTPPQPQAPARPVSAAPAAPAAQPAEPPPDVRLDITGDIGTGLVTGKQVIPAKLDTEFHNAPPAYPPAAAHRGEEGVVELLIHVAPDGSAGSVEVTKSSGHPILDRAARDAVTRWHFRPAEQDGVPVRSELPFNVHFELGRQGSQWSE